MYYRTTVLRVVVETNSISILRSLAIVLLYYRATVLPCCCTSRGCGVNIKSKTKSRSLYGTSILRKSLSSLTKVRSFTTVYRATVMLYSCTCSTCGNNLNSKSRLRSLTSVLQVYRTFFAVTVFSISYLSLFTAYFIHLLLRIL